MRETHTICNVAVKLSTRMCLAALNVSTDTSLIKQQNVHLIYKPMIYFRILSVVNGSSSSTQNSSLSQLTVATGPVFTARDTRDILVGLASSVENSEAIVDFIVSQAATLESM